MGRRTGFVPESERGRDKQPDGLPLVRTCECGTKFLYAISPRGRAVPVEAQVNFTGGLLLCFEVDQDDRPISGQLVMATPEGYKGARWTDHRLTCPKVSYHARRAALRGEL